MNKQQLLERLKKQHEHQDPERAHPYADDLLLEYINDKEITKPFKADQRWYA